MNKKLFVDALIFTIFLTILEFAISPNLYGLRYDYINILKVATDKSLFIEIIPLKKEYLYLFKKENIDFEYFLSTSSKVRITLKNVQNQSTIIGKEEDKDSGVNFFQWDGRDTVRTIVPEGDYNLEISALDIDTGDTFKRNIIFKVKIEAPYGLELKEETSAIDVFPEWKTIKKFNLEKFGWNIAVGSLGLLVGIPMINRKNDETDKNNENNEKYIGWGLAILGGYFILKSFDSYKTESVKDYENIKKTMRYKVKPREQIWK